MEIDSEKEQREDLTEGNSTLLEEHFTGKTDFASLSPEDKLRWLIHAARFVMASKQKLPT